MFDRILLAVDGSDTGHVAASFVSAMARRSAAVRVVHVNEIIVGGRGYARLTDREAMQVVDDAVRILAVAGIPADGEVRVAAPFDVAARIADAADQWGADVIVLGSRRQRRLHRVLARLSGPSMREQVTALTVLPTLTAPAPLDLGRLDLDAPGSAPTRVDEPHPVR
jgi:nucleotide-binding universal stress UspA family protein